LLQINEADFIHKHKIKLINFDLPLLGQIQTAKKISLKDLPSGGGAQ
jgi:hypothetical protein